MNQFIVSTNVMYFDKWICNGLLGLHVNISWWLHFLISLCYLKGCFCKMTIFKSMFFEVEHVSNIYL